MNKDAIKRTIESIKLTMKNDPEGDSEKQIGFDMDNFLGISGYALDYKGEPCGTVACIAGHACISHVKEITGTEMSRHVPYFEWASLADKVQGEYSRRGREILDIDDDQGSKLFYVFHIKDFLGEQYRPPTPEDAIQVLDHLLETGEVDWSIVKF